MPEPRVRTAFYEGPIVIRPHGRGLYLDNEVGNPYIEDWLADEFGLEDASSEGWRGMVIIRVEMTVEGGRASSASSRSSRGGTEVKGD